MPSSSPSSSRSSSPEISPSLTCILCDVQCNNHDALFRHYQGKKHKKQAAALKTHSESQQSKTHVQPHSHAQPTPPSHSHQRYQPRCDTCDQAFSSAASLQTHLHSRSHQSAQQIYQKAYLKGAQNVIQLISAALDDLPTNLQAKSAISSPSQHSTTPLMPSLSKHISFFNPMGVKLGEHRDLSSPPLTSLSSSSNIRYDPPKSHSHASNMSVALGSPSTLLTNLKLNNTLTLQTASGTLNAESLKIEQHFHRETSTTCTSTPTSPISSTSTTTPTLPPHYTSDINILASELHQALHCHERNIFFKSIESGLFHSIIRNNTNLPIDTPYHSNQERLFDGLDETEYCWESGHE